jgi:hypothetical protein
MNILSEKTENGKIARSKLANKIHAHLENLISSLYYRWQDEKEYEDFKDYTDALMKKVMEVAPKGTKLVKGHKRPFGITISIPAFPYNIKIGRNASSYYWKQSK